MGQLQFVILKQSAWSKLGHRFLLSNIWRMEKNFWQFSQTDKQRFWPGECDFIQEEEGETSAGATSWQEDTIQPSPPLLSEVIYLTWMLYPGDTLVIPSATIVNNIFDSCKKPQRMTVWDWCCVDHDWQDLNVTVWLQQYPPSDILKRLLWLKQGRALAGLSICWI